LRLDRAAGFRFVVRVAREFVAAARRRPRFPGAVRLGVDRRLDVGFLDARFATDPPAR
jgi:hypothetical protein